MLRGRPNGVLSLCIRTQRRHKPRHLVMDSTGF